MIRESVSAQAAKGRGPKVGCHGSRSSAMAIGCRASVACGRTKLYGKRWSLSVPRHGRHGGRSCVIVQSTRSACRNELPRMRHWRPDVTGLPSEARLDNARGFVVFVCLTRVTIRWAWPRQPEHLNILGSMQKLMQARLDARFSKNYDRLVDKACPTLFRLALH